MPDLIRYPKHTEIRCADCPTLNGRKLAKIKDSPPSRFSVARKVMAIQKKYRQIFQ